MFKELMLSSYVYYCRSASLEKEKKQLDQVLKTKMQEFEEERSRLQTQIAKMSEDLRVRVNAQEKVEALQVQLLSKLLCKIVICYHGYYPGHMVCPYNISRVVLFI